MAKGKTPEQFKNEFNEKVGESFTLLEDYKNNRTPILIKHNICGREWAVRATGFLKKPTCSECNKKALRDEFLGKVFGFWTVLEEVETLNSNHISYLCECTCGKTGIIRKTFLLNGRSLSCGCSGSLLMKDKVFSKLKVITDGYRKENGRIYVKARCECGTEKEVMKQSLESGLTQSCGCLNKEILRSRIGLLNQNYKPDLTDEERAKNNSRGSQSSYQSTRRKVLNRDKNTCQCCGFTREKNMRVHHLNGWSWFAEGRYDLNNLITLCPKCHDIQYEGSFHNIYGNHNNTEAQYNEYIAKYNKERSA